MDGVSGICVVCKFGRGDGVTFKELFDFVQKEDGTFGFERNLVPSLSVGMPGPPQSQGASCGCDVM